jgi:hypothetical protein
MNTQAFKPRRARVRPIEILLAAGVMAGLSFAYLRLSHKDDVVLAPAKHIGAGLQRVVQHRNTPVAWRVAEAR